MTNFKSGSGNLDFDADESPAEESSTASQTTRGEELSDEVDGPAAASAAGSEPGSDRDASDVSGSEPAAPAPSEGETYPYFVRRNNVGDERDTRLEIHVRDKVAEGEAQFRHELAAELGASDVSKTDAREFALLAAFRHPERVAELMRAEGFDSLG